MNSTSSQVNRDFGYCHRSAIALRGRINKYERSAGEEGILQDCCGYFETDGGEFGGGVFVVAGGVEVDAAAAGVELAWEMRQLLSAEPGSSKGST